MKSSAFSHTIATRERLEDVYHKLHTSEADQVFAALVAFKEAHVEYHFRLGFCLHERVSSLIEASNAAADVYRMKSRELNVLLYGEEEVLRREYE